MTTSPRDASRIDHSGVDVASYRHLAMSGPGVVRGVDVARCKHSSVPNFLRTGGPFLERYLGIIRHQSEMRNLSQFRHPRNFAVNEPIIKPDLRRLGPRISVVNTPQSRPIDRAEAHRAGLATRVDVAVWQVKRAKQRTGAANGYDLGMRGRVVARRNLIPAF